MIIKLILWLLSLLLKVTHNTLGNMRKNVKKNKIKKKKILKNKNNNLKFQINVSK